MANFNEDIRLKITGDSSEAISAIEKIDASLKGFNQGFQDLQDRLRAPGFTETFTAAFQHPIEFIKGMADGINNELTDSLKNAGVTADSVKAQLNAFIDEPAKTIKEFSKGVLDGMIDELGLVGIAGVAAGVGLFELGKQAFGMAEHWAHVGEGIQDASEKMSISVERTSLLKFAVEAAGSSLGQLSSAIFMMQNRMESSPTTFEAGLRSIGLSLQGIEALSPDEKFLAIASAIRQSGDETNQQRVAMELFGRAGREILPLVHKDLEQLIEDGKQAGAMWSKDQAEAAEHLAIKTRELSLEWDQLKRSMEAWLIGPVDFVIEKLNALAEAERHHAKGEFPGLADVESDFDPSKIKLPAAQRGDIALSQDTGPHAPTFDEETENLRRDREKNAELKKAAEEAAAAYKKWAEATDELNVVGEGWQGTLDTIDGTVVEGIKYYLDAGFTQGTLAAAYNLTAAQVKSVASEVKEEADAAKASTEAHIFVADAIDKVAAAAEKAATKLPTLKDDIEAAGRAGHFAGMGLLEMGGAFTDVGDSGNLESIQAGGIGALPDGVGHAIPKVAGPSITAGFEKLFTDQVPNAILAAVEGGGSPFQAVGSVIGKQLGTNIGKDLAGHLGSEGFGKFLGESFSSILPGVGALIGPAIEKMWEHFHKPEWQKLAHDVGRDWGMHISDGLAQKMEEDSKKFGRQATELLHMKDIFAEQGGITPENLGQAETHLHDVFSLIDQGQLTIAQGAKIIDDNWKDMVAAGTDAFGFLDKNLREIIRLDGAVGTHSKAIADYLKQQADIALTASSQIIAGAIEPQIAEWDKLKKAVDDATAAHNPVAIQKATGAQGAAAATAKPQLDDLGVIATGTFNAALGSGKSYAEALAAAAPGLNQLAKAYHDLGLSINDAALKELTLQSAILQKNPTLIQGVSALGQSFAALSNMGQLNVETFHAMQRTGSDMAQRLYNEATTMGGGLKDALLPMQDYLHKAEAAAKELGIPLDDNTQLLVQQSKDLGIWKEAGKTANEKMLEGTEKMVAATEHLASTLDAIAEKLGAKIPANAEKAAKALALAMSTAPPDFHTSDQPEPPTAHTGAIVWANNFQHLHDGGFPKLWGMQPDEVFAILKQGEAVMQPSAVQSLGPEVMRAVNTGSAAAVMSATLPRLPRPTRSASSSTDQGSTTGGKLPDIVFKVGETEMGRVSLNSVFLGPNRAYFNELVRQAKR